MPVAVSKDLSDAFGCKEGCDVTICLHVFMYVVAWTNAQHPTRNIRQAT